MLLLIKVFIFFWLIRTIKSILFWIYLWQLKEYHVGRFLDHFRTDKGKKLIFGFLPVFKILLLIWLFFGSYFFTFIVFYILLILYAVESLSFVKTLYKKEVKKPVATLKTALLEGLSFFLVFFFLLVSIHFSSFGIVIALLVFDILLPKIASAIVLMVQPFFVFARNGVLDRASGKIKRLKHLKVIAITGSYGKTSTKEFLTTILSSKFNVLSTPEHKNSEIGIAQTILHNLNEKHEVFVVEMGSYNKGGIKLLCDMVRPWAGIVTGVNEQHLSTFGSMENLLSAEGGRELLMHLPGNGILLINGDNKYCVDLYKKANIHKRLYATSPERIQADIWAQELSVHEDSLDFAAVTQDKHTTHFHVNVLGKQQIQNLLGAILMAKELGMSLEEISKACKKIKPEQGGMTLKNGLYGINVIDSSYSSNPDGVMADLDYLKTFEGKKVIIMTCLIELGYKSAQVHREIGQKIAEVCDLAIITTKDRFEDIRAGAEINGMREDRIKFSENSQQIFHAITTFCKEGDAVLLEGRVPSELIRLLTKK